MRAYSMDLRERVLRESDAGMKRGRRRGQIPRQCLLGPAAQNNGAARPAKSPHASSGTGGIRCLPPSCTRSRR